MKPLAFAFLAGPAAACGFQPLGLWPLTLRRLRPLWPAGRRPRRACARALARGWWFGLGHFTLGLNWIATAFTYQAAMPAWLGWVAVVLLSLYLAVFPAVAAGLAWRWGRRRAAAARPAARRRLDRHRMAARDPVHRLSLESGRRRAAADLRLPPRHPGRHLRPVGDRRPARRRAAAARRAALARRRRRSRSRSLPRPCC